MSTPAVHPVEAPPVTNVALPRMRDLQGMPAAVRLQIIWNLVLAIADIYAILVQRSFRNAAVTIGDGVTSTLTCAATCASAGITVLICTDLDKCSLNHCTRFMAATTMAFLSWFSLSVF
ncbi:putative ubiquitin-like protein 5-like isoform 1 [Capsicum annuum]|nr:putative ubiquitin-like protein 5-like isoform 1 [Capsicum annuum]